MEKTLPPYDNEIERHFLINAVEKARRDPQPSIPDELVQARMQQKVEELQMKIAALHNISRAGL